MRLIACHDGKLLTVNSESPAAGVAGNQPAFSSGVPQWDALAPGGAFARGAVHELLTDPADGKALFFAMLLARLPTGIIVWCDPAGELYPPALAAYGFPLDRLFLVHPKDDLPAANLPNRPGRRAYEKSDGKNLLWTIAECLRCKAVAAVVATPPPLSRIAARRIQLAAERGGSVGILLRHTGRGSAHHAAASRWLIRPAPGARTTQRWSVQLLHGHGGRIGQTLCLEHCRETNHLHPFDPVADRPAPPLALAEGA